MGSPLGYSFIRLVRDKRSKKGLSRVSDYNVTTVTFCEALEQLAAEICDAYELVTPTGRVQGR